MERVDVAVVGGGQAGLSISHELAALDVEHVVLERARVGQSWRDRWDSFCLVTPNWFVRLPGGWYEGPDPDGYLTRQELADYFDSYAASLPGTVREGVSVEAADAHDGTFALRTSEGELRARSVVLATGAYQVPFRPPGAASLPPALLQLDATDYRNPGDLPPGGVLVIGSGQTGCQLTEELVESGREVVLSCGRAPWMPRRIDDRDLVWWVLETGFLDMLVEDLASPALRLTANIQATGHGGGHDLHYRTLRAMEGVTLVGRFLGSDGRRATFADDLGDSVAWGDERHVDLMNLVRTLVAERGMDPFDILPPPPFNPAAPAEVDLAGFGAALFTGGFRPAYRSWLPWDAAFDADGFPLHVGGASTVVPGLFFVGVHFLRKRKSSLLGGVAEDAAIVAQEVRAGLEERSRG
jgi:putative flavoprotein involved in K+ transport